jgi:hypothetical protein
MPPTIVQLQTKVQELQTALDVEQQQVADLIAARDATIASLEGHIITLETMIAEGGTDAERQLLLESMQATLDDLKSTVPDQPPVS